MLLVSLSGKPLLCNDPHLTLMAPSIWILNSIATPSTNTVGSSFPGLPSVVIGRNEHIAWGVTDTGVDVEVCARGFCLCRYPAHYIWLSHQGHHHPQDFYIMQEKEGDNSKYLYKGAYVPYTLRNEVIAIKDKPSMTMVVRESVYGPVFNDNGLNTDLGSTPLCLQFISIMKDVNDTTLDAFLAINKAQNWEQYRAALSKYVAPAQNFIYADIEGNIGYQMPGLIPVRQKSHTGAVPVPGDGSFDWQGYVPFDSLPRTFNPSADFVASANNRVTPVTKYACPSLSRLCCCLVLTLHWFNTATSTC